MKWIKMYTRKELNGMFTEGQLVIYGGEGVCRIAAVGPSSLSGTDKTKLYYTLTPLTRSGTVLTPVDTKVLMRPILSRQEAEDFIAQLPQLPPEEPESRSMRLLKEFYQQIVTSYDCRRMAGLIRSAVRRRKHALRTGRKVSQMDERYLRRAESALYGELAAGPAGGGGTALHPPHLPPVAGMILPTRFFTWRSPTRIRRVGLLLCVYAFFTGSGRCHGRCTYKYTARPAP